MDMRRELGMQMYDLMGIRRDDKKGRAAALFRNWTFFDAPVGIIFTIDRAMGPPQWFDVGCLMQSFMLLCREYGWHTCAQEAWAEWPKTIRGVCSIPDNEIVFAGVGVGKARTDVRGNELRSMRAPLNEWAKFEGWAAPSKL